MLVWESTCYRAAASAASANWLAGGPETVAAAWKKKSEDTQSACVLDQR